MYKGKDEIPSWRIAKAPGAAGAPLGGGVRGLSGNVEPGTELCEMVREDEGNCEMFCGGCAAARGGGDSSVLNP
jgi:hypothetical protein